MWLLHFFVLGVAAAFVFGCCHAADPLRLVQSMWIHMRTDKCLGTDKGMCIDTFYKANQLVYIVMALVQVWLLHFVFGEVVLLTVIATSVQALKDARCIELVSIHTSMLMHVRMSEHTSMLMHASMYVHTSMPMHTRMAAYTSMHGSIHAPVHVYMPHVHDDK